MNTTFRFARSAFLPALILLLAACAIRDKTTLDTSWVSPERPRTPFKKVLIITVSRNEFAQADFQDLMAQKLQARGMNAVASHRYFTNYADAERKRFKETIEASDADAVLVTRVTNTETDTRDVADYSLYMYPSMVQTETDHTLTTLTSEAAIFDRKTEKLLWTARAKTKNAGTGDRDAALSEYVGVLIDAMAKDKLI